MINVLVIDDEKEVGTFFYHLLKDKGYAVTLGHSYKDSQQKIMERSYDLSLIDVMLPDGNGIDLLKEMKKTHPACKVIVMTGYSTVKTAVEAIKFGASDYIEKPFDNLDELEELIDQLLKRPATPIESDLEILADRVGFVIGEHLEMKHLVKIAYKIAKKNVNVLIEGETGTGKEVLAHFIHQASLRSENPFISMNCGAISESLLESELFGHEKGAFTGALKEKKGVVEIANKGTLFLDEIGEASMATQVKLLRVLETGDYMRVGGEKICKTHTRVIAASHVNLAHAVAEKKFREDLLYRLDVVKLNIPPLRERKEDLPLLIEFFLKKLESPLTFSNEAIELMSQYTWPGNIRELFNVIKRSVTLAEDEVSIITPPFLPDKIRHSKIHPTKLLSVQKKTDQYTTHFEPYVMDKVKQILMSWKSDQAIDLDDILQEVRQLEDLIGKAFVTKALKETVGNRKEAAKMLNITERKLRYLLKEKGHFHS
ncbi:two-component system NtrC family response regulator [Oikeobacillus pervagus]|uniref:Two-component system NtrC family response regulator n=1 Tax=Oikeobacillus pervagus TaxID=1325931 RepID=A0AAJ1WII3_9BACI|nr:sigma-54 dependent transcriptional regulator [Oikeobacillus pervagus]MDQ0214378.1 two-component system NtrC family response regulator [Oikeobacillus pervagus]